MAYQLTPLPPLGDLTDSGREEEIKRYKTDIEKLDKDNREDDDQETVPLPRCTQGEIVFYAEWAEPLAAGHIYSQSGLEVFAKHGLCSWHAAGKS